jgi:hypothetical protein
VDVPWRSEFEQRFTLTLQKESPVVLVMSQLDDRYFAGLCGQYQFRLQFRLHEIGSLDEEDYIVRSHGNYLMNRSVVSELKSLPAGTYSVFMMVVAERNKDDLTVEDIVKAQLRRKEDNDKLEQVGAAYDMAHGKALPYMEARAKAKEAHNKNKAKEARIAQRKVLWEKRHTTRQIVRKQEKKNREKREAKEVKEAAAEKEKEDRKPKDSGVQTEEVVEKQIEKHDKSIQTEEHPPQAVETKIDTQVLRDTDKAVQTDDISLSCIGSQATPTTPKSDNISPESPYVIIRHADRRSHGVPPPPPPASYYNRRDSAAQRDYGHPPPPPPPRNYVTSEGESSASPISDYDMYSDEDPSLKMRNPNSAPDEQSKSKGNESDGEEEQPDPWNAVCVIGFRVYSKDEGLVLKVYDEYLCDEEATVKGSEEDANDGDVEDALDDANSQENKGREDESTKASGEEPNPAPLTPSNTIDESINRPASIETGTQAPPGERNIVKGGREVALVDEATLQSNDSNVEREGETVVKDATTTI